MELDLHNYCADFVGGFVLGAAHNLLFSGGWKGGRPDEGNLVLIDKVWLDY